jgi:predicted transposase YbfD/YdcC
METFLSYFSMVSDFRVLGRCLHTLSDILGLVLCGVLSDCDTFVDICDYGKDNQVFLQDELGFSFSNGIPSEDTLERIFKHLDTKELEECYSKLAQEMSVSLRQIMIDGKELRSCIPKGKKHSLVQLVNVWVSDLSLSFGQVKVDKKSNEIEAIPALLKMINCENSVVSIDAIGCQKDIVSDIVDKKADYVIALKKNQKGLYEQIEAEFSRCLSDLPCHESRDLDHGRAEHRKVYLLEDLRFVEMTKEWKKLNSVVMVERNIWRDGELKTTKRFYISSLCDKTPKQMGEYIRNHWAIENELHWQLDVTFKEDDSRVRAENAIINLHLIRKWALFLLKKEPSKISLNRKRKKAARSNQFLKSILE